MTGKRTKYSGDFKAKVALEAIRGEMTLAQLAAKHGVHQTLINSWKRQAIEMMWSPKIGHGAKLVSFSKKDETYDRQTHEVFG